MAGFFKKALGVFVEVPEGADEHDDVSIDDLNDEARRLLAEIEAGSDAAPPPAAEAPPPPPSAPVPTGGDFADIYAAAGVPPSPYSAEMLLKVAEGLRAMPLDQARAAVHAMDGADDRWTVGDVLLDADRKIDALNGVQQAVVTSQQQAEQRYDAVVQSLDSQLAATQTEIRKQIEELQALFTEAGETAAVEKATALSELEATRNSAQAEASRLQVEVDRLRQVHGFFDDGTAGA